MYDIFGVCFLMCGLSNDYKVTWDHYSSPGGPYYSYYVAEISAEITCGFLT